MNRRNLTQVNFFAWLFCAALSVLEINRFLAGAKQVDFGYFYSIGHILNHYPAERIYDVALQAAVFKSVLPASMSGLVYGPSPYPPLITLLLHPLAKLPFWSAFWTWSLLSLLLYVTALLLLVKRFCPNDRTRQSILCCVGLSLWSFTGRTLLNGQLSTLGFIGIALAILAQDGGQPFLAGLALGVCAYKPTLLVLILPMLVVTRRFKVIAGFLSAVSVLAAITTLVEGTAVWPAYLNMIMHVPREKVYLTADHVDLLTFSSAASHGSMVLRGLILGAGVGVLGLLVQVWRLGWRNSSSLPPTLIWGTTLTWTLLLNVYAPLYDTILVVISLIITRRFISQFSYRAFIAACLLIVFSSYGARELASTTGVQIVTPVLALFGGLQLLVCFRMLSRSLLSHFGGQRSTLAQESAPPVLPLATQSQI